MNAIKIYTYPHAPRFFNTYLRLTFFPSKETHADWHVWKVEFHAVVARICSIYHIPPVPPNSFRVRTWRTRIIILMHTCCVARHICPGHGWRTVWTSCHGLRYNVEDRDVPNVGGCHLMRCLRQCGLSCFTMKSQSRRWKSRWSVWRLHDWVSWQDNTFIAIVCPAALISPPTLPSFVKMMTNNIPRSASCPTNSALHQIPASNMFAPSGFDMTQRGCGERPTQCWCKFGTDRCSIWNVYDHVL